MRELIYTLLELEWEFRNRTCDFCSNRYGEDNKSVNQIRTRNKTTNKLIANDIVCEDCKEKFLNDELPKCDKCGRLQNETDISLLKYGGKCDCEKEEKELPNVPYESQATFYERQINSLQEQLNGAEWTITEEREAHEDFMKTSEEWGKKQKQELIDEIARLKQENGTYKEKIRNLEELLKQLNSTENLETKIEQLPKTKPWKQLFNKKN